MEKTLAACPSPKTALTCIFLSRAVLKLTFTTYKRVNVSNNWVEERQLQLQTAWPRIASTSHAAQTVERSISSTSPLALLPRKWRYLLQAKKAKKNLRIRKWLIRLKKVRLRTQRADSTSCLASCPTTGRSSPSASSNATTTPQSRCASCRMGN